MKRNPPLSVSVLSIADPPCRKPEIIKSRQPRPERHRPLCSAKQSTAWYLRIILTRSTLEQFILLNPLEGFHFQPSFDRLTGYNQITSEIHLLGGCVDYRIFSSHRAHDELLPLRLFVLAKSRKVFHLNQPNSSSSLWS